MEYPPTTPAFEVVPIQYGFPPCSMLPAAIASLMSVGSGLYNPFSNAIVLECRGSHSMFPYTFYSKASTEGSDIAGIYRGF